MGKRTEKIEQNKKESIWRYKTLSTLNGSAPVG